MAKRLTMNTRKGKPFSEVWGEFITSQTAKGVSEITLRNYRQVLHNITRFFDVETPMDELSKRRDFAPVFGRAQKSHRNTTETKKAEEHEKLCSSAAWLTANL